VRRLAIAERKTKLGDELVACRREKIGGCECGRNNDDRNKGTTAIKDSRRGERKARIPEARGAAPARAAAIPTF
jgi:hypothetical protein